MKTYSQFQPTGFDTRGLGLPDRQEWLVLGVSQTRDSGPLAQSNYATALRILDDAGAVYEEHRFGHWGPGRFDIILVRPDGIDACEGIENALADYPVLDDSDYSAREHSAAERAWSHTSMSERVRLSHKYGFHLMACRRDELPDSSELVSYLADGC